jgi:hypothetical protein
LQGKINVKTSHFGELSGAGTYFEFALIGVEKRVLTDWPRRKFRLSLRASLGRDSLQEAVPPSFKGKQQLGINMMILARLLRINGRSTASLAAVDPSSPTRGANRDLHAYVSSTQHLLIGFGRWETADRYWN